MASDALPPAYLTAGGDYLSALQRLGMRPQFLGWGWEVASEHWLLVLVTPIIDRGGALALNELLFRAYNAEATPNAISPFIVRVFSPEVVGTTLDVVKSRNLTIGRVMDRHGRPKPVTDNEGKPVQILEVSTEFFGIKLSSKHAYEASIPARRSNFDRSIEWQRFKTNVMRLPLAA